MWLFVLADMHPEGAGEAGTTMHPIETENQYAKLQIIAFVHAVEVYACGYSVLCDLLSLPS